MSAPSPGSRLDAGARRLEAALGHRVRVVERLVDLPDRAAGAVVAGAVRMHLKVDTDSDRSRHEVAAIAAAREAGVGVPEVVHHESGPPAVLALSWVDGPALSDDGPGWDRAGEALARLHAVPPYPGARHFDGCTDTWRACMQRWVDLESTRSVELGGLGQDEATAMRDRLVVAFRALPERRPVLLHGDLQPDHVLLAPPDHQPVLLDWGDAGTGDPLWDIAVLVLDHPHRLGDVLTGYGPGPAMSDHVERFLTEYRLLRYLGEISWLIERGFDATASIDGARSIAAG